MAVYTPLSDVTVEAFQWIGDPLENYALPGWALALSLHAPSDQMLHVPCHNGTFAARIGDWIVKYPTGEVDVVSDQMFSSLYNVDDVAVEETRKTATEKRAAAKEAEALAAEERANSAAATRDAKASEQRRGESKQQKGLTMANHTQRGSIVVDAFQWNGGTIAGTTMPYWAKALPLHTPGDGSLNIPTSRGTERVDIGEWVVRNSTNTINILTNAAFTALYS